MTLKRLLFLVMILLAALPVVAQGNSPITAQVDTTHATTDDVIQLQVTITSDQSSLPQPSLPTLEGFDIVGSGSSSQFTINGQMSAQVTYTFLPE